MKICVSEYLAEHLPAKGGGPAAEAREAAPAAALPCLNTNNCNEGEKPDSRSLSPAHRKAVHALTLNVLWLIERHGLEHIGFLTLTFARHVVSFKEAQKALHSLMTGVLRQRYPEYITVMERMDSKRIHYHLLVVMADDIRTGFDFAAVKKGKYTSASVYLRREWQFWRTTAPKYGFGRTELLPIRKTAEGVAKYVGKYIAKHIGRRLPEDKGARLVRYSKGTNRASVRFSWASAGAFIWRTKLGAFCRKLNCNADNYQELLKNWFGKNWVYVLRPLIEAVPVFRTDAESLNTMQALWCVALNERERRSPRKERPVVVSKRPVPERRAAWIDRTVKDD